MAKVTIKPNENYERAVKRFKRKVEQAGIMREIRKRECYLKPSVKKKVKEKAAESRLRRRLKKFETFIPRPPV